MTDNFWRNFSGAFCAASLLALAPLQIAHARTLAEIKARGILELCANPGSLPYSSKNQDNPGFQVEIAHALAQGLGVNLSVAWIVPTYRDKLVNCDIHLDAFNDSAVHEGKLKLSRPYQRNGVVLGLHQDNAGDIKRFDDLKQGQKIGVMINSAASVILGKKGLTTSPYAFEADMLDDLVKGDLFGCAISVATISYYRKQHPETNLSLVYPDAGESDLSWSVTVGMRKADDALVSAMDEVIDKLLANETFKTIYTKYGIEHRAP